MRLTSVRVTCLALTAIASIGTQSAGQGAPTHQTNLSIRVTTRGGRARLIALEGVGCSASMCSKKMIKVRTENDSVTRLWLDGIAAIRAITDHDAVFLMKDGAQKRLALVKDFRVLYLTGDSGRSDKLGLETAESIEFVSASR